MPADISGHMLFHQGKGEFELRKGPVFANLILADEINRASAKTQSALLEAMGEGQVTIEGNCEKLPKPFFVMATQNPIDQEGTYPLPEAQMDRFQMKLLLQYPHIDDEISIYKMFRLNGEKNDNSKNNSSPMNIKSYIKCCAFINTIRVDDSILKYVADIIHNTRKNEELLVGAGPRGGLSIIAACRVNALLQGRDFVIPDDVKELTIPCLRHRIILGPALELEGVHPDNVLQEVLQSVSTPAN